MNLHIPILLKKKLKPYIIKLIGKRLNLLYDLSPKKAVDKSFKLFLTPTKGRVREEQRAFLNTADKKFVNIKGQRLQTYRWGSGINKVLLVHGWESNTSRWESLVTRLLKNDFSVISIDAPAHGDSDGKYSNVPLYAEAIAHIIRDDQVKFAVGHSLGGFTLLYAGYQNKLRGLEKLVLLAPATEMKNIVQTFQRTLRLKHELVKGFENEFKSNFGYKLSEFSIQKLMPNFSIPTLFVHDKEDLIVSYKESEQVACQWQQAELLLTHGLKHSLKSEKVDGWVIDFMNGIKVQEYDNERQIDSN